MATQGGAATDAPTVTLGLLGDPGLPNELSDNLAEQLPDLLEHETDGRARWRVETASQQLTLDEHGRLPSVEIGQHAMAEHRWDLVILVTELPRRAGTQPIVSDYGLATGVGLVSLPALGAMGLRRQARKVIVHQVAEHLIDKPLGDGGDGHGQGPRAHRALGPGAPVQHIDSTDEGIDTHLALTGTRGRLRLLAGMVRANRPWRLVPSLSPAIAGAAAGAAFGVFYSNIWQLADAFSGWRLTLVNVLAVLAMIAWLIIDNSLWERPSGRQLREEAALYNAATTLTISIGVLCMYSLLFVVTLISALVVIPPDYLTSTLKHPSGFSEFAIVAWLSASMGTIAGALGSGLASEDAVRQAAYSKREQERRQSLRAQDQGAP
ncbi:hypothetical protein EV191_1362 [Tamaricihabitans halophyticus]|uniref:Uncharacterized protein n=1 Tax=Tamaricihabitans halophyticus TaxID=1262583 RepID=A0A4V2SQF7_9PSEU|nr:hypothetical protein [Tamaricihabitans halophyticus]TCP38826.1 hypothetical protein EV191_1362 [Tamaricihabitans halophyticus]